MDANITLQQLLPVVEDTGIQQTLDFFCEIGHSNMLPLGEQVFALGKILQVTLCPDEATALGVACEEPVNDFTRIYKNGMFYHFLAYHHVSGKNK